MNKENREHATNEAILQISNDEFLYNTFLEVETVTELGEIFRVYVAPRIREGINLEVYSLRDIDFADLLESIETKIGK